MVFRALLIILLTILSSKVDAFDRKGFYPTAPFSVFSTFSAESLAQGKIALDLGYEVTVDPDMSRMTLNISYGLRDNVEVLLNVPYVLKYSNAIDSHGFEDIAIGIKHRVIDETKLIPAIAYALYGSGHFGEDKISTEGGWGVGLILTKKVGPVKAHGNLIYFRPNRDTLNDSWSLNLGSELSLSYNSKLLFELIGRKAVYRNRIDLIEWKLGYRIRITDFSYTTVGIGFDIKKRNPEFRFIFGISTVLPPERTQVRLIVD